jgi:hypothetical protein
LTVAQEAAHAARERAGARHRLVHAAAGEGRWLEFARGADPTLFSEPSWGAMIEAVYGFPARVALLLDGDDVVAGLPYGEVEDFRGLRRVANCFADVCEPLGEEWPQLERLLRLERVPLRIRSRVRPGALCERVHDGGVHQELDLRLSLHEAERRCDRATRTNVRNALRGGLTARITAGPEGIDAFYELHSRVRKDKHRLLPQPRAYFDEIFRRYFPERGFVLVAEHAGTPVAAILLLVCGKALYVKLSASDLGKLYLRPNDFLWWSAIELALERGFETLDFGISDTEGLARFKRNFGATSKPVFAGDYHPLSKSAPVLDMERALGELTATFTDPNVPLGAAQRAGDALYRFFV